MKDKQNELDNFLDLKADIDTRLDIEVIQNKELQIKMINYHLTGLKFPKADDTEKEVLEGLLRRLTIQWLDRQSVYTEIQEIQPIEGPNLPDHIKENAYWAISQERKGTQPRNANTNRPRNFVMNKMSKFYFVYSFIYEIAI